MESHGGGDAQVGGYLRWCLSACDDLFTHPVCGTEELTGEYVGLHFLPFSLGIALNLRNTRGDWITRQAGISQRDFATRIEVKMKVSELVGKDLRLRFRSERAYDMHQTVLAFEDSQDPRSE
jgi:hypothetical protein